MENTKFFESDIFKKSAITVLAVLALFLLGKTINEFTRIGEKDMYSVQDMITVTGKGEAFAVPDIATFTFSVTESGKDVSDAQKKVTDKNNAAIKYLKDNGIDEKDIKTENYNANPKYDYRPCTAYVCPPALLSGYEVTQTTSVKVRNVEKAGEILSGIGATGVTNISGLSFVVDDQETIKAEARTLAIADAKEKAKKLTKELGVKIESVSSFWEQDNENTPMYAEMDSKVMGMGGANVAPVISTGQNKVTVIVNVTYRIK